MKISTIRDMMTGNKLNALSLYPGPNKEEIVVLETTAGLQYIFFPKDGTRRDLIEEEVARLIKDL